MTVAKRIDGKARAAALAASITEKTAALLKKQEIKEDSGPLHWISALWQTDKSTFSGSST